MAKRDIRLTSPEPEIDHKWLGCFVGWNVLLIVSIAVQEFMQKHFGAFMCNDFQKSDSLNERD